jgi:peptidoglycan/xylan/chitin deacetylase (PgdA/CDA1 family)
MASVSPAGAAESRSGVLQSCWNPALLAGHPDEKAARLQHHSVALPNLPPPAEPGSVMGTVRRVHLPPGKRLVALTFDLCEGALEVAGYDGGVIDYLRANKVKATLFAGGKWMVSHGERTAQLMADPLFEIGTHGWAHANLHILSGDAVDQEIGGAVAAYDEARRALMTRSCAQGSPELARLPEQPKLFRFPFGTCHPEALAAVARSGQLAIQWDVVTGDPDPGLTPEAIARAVLAETKPGSIIVAHANGRGAHTAEALPLFVPQLRARGFAFVTVSELLAAGTPEIAPTCYERHPGDNQRYDIARLRKDGPHHAPAEHAARPAHPKEPPRSWPVHIERWP